MLSPGNLSNAESSLPCWSRTGHYRVPTGRGGGGGGGGEEGGQGQVGGGVDGVGGLVSRRQSDTVFVCCHATTSQWGVNNSKTH